MSNEETRKWWALGAIGVSMLTVGVDATILNVALPTVSADSNASPCGVRTRAPRDS